jgi:DNA-binding transcriptional regulator YdaS (Cro superfamily)
MSIKQVVKQFGGPSKLAVTLGVTPQAVCFWRDGKRRFPAEQCMVIERISKGAWRCEQLRPDLDWAVLRNSDCPEKVAA